MLLIKELWFVLVHELTSQKAPAESLNLPGETPERCRPLEQKKNTSWNLGKECYLEKKGWNLDLWYVILRQISAYRIPASYGSCDI